jgi:hypothetical protein
MQTSQVQVTVFQLAEIIVEPRLQQEFPALVQKARELIKAKSKWKDTLESPEGIRVTKAIDAFWKEYDASTAKRAVTS